MLVLLENASITAVESLNKIDSQSVGTDPQATSNTIGLICLAAQLAFEVGLFFAAIHVLCSAVRIELATRRNETEAKGF